MSTRIWLFFLLLGSPVVAQSYHVHTYSENDGLPSSAIRDIAQDPSGRMWFATRAGLARFDGVSWTVYDIGRGNGPVDLAALDFDEAGVLWCVTRLGVEVTRHDPATGEIFEPLASPKEMAVEEVLSLAASRRKERTRVAVGTRRGLFLWDGEAWHTPADSLPRGEIRGLVAAEGRLYAATADAVGEIGDGTFRPYSRSVLGPLAEGRILGLVADKVGTVWVMGQRPGADGTWLGRLGDRGAEIVVDDLSAPVPYLGDPRLFLDVAGSVGDADSDRDADLVPDVYYGNAEDLYHLAPGAPGVSGTSGSRTSGSRTSGSPAVEILGSRAGLIARGVTALHRDREGNVWVGGLRGLSKIVSLRFANYNQAQGLLENEVSAVLAHRAGGFVLGHPHGLTWLGEGLDPASVETLRFDIPPGLRGQVRVLDLAEDEAGRVWIAASGLGLGRLESSRRLVWLRQAGPRIARSIRVDRQQRIWAASDDELYQFGIDRFEVVAAGFEGRLRRIVEGASGALWVLSDGGLYRFDERGRVGPFRASSDPASNVYAVLEGEASTEAAWVGTAAGLYRLRGERLVRSSAPRVERPVYFLLRDERGRLWIGTDNGVMRFDGEHLEHFTARDGLSGRETNRAAGLVDRHGRVWIGTDRGVSVYRDRYERRWPPPLLELLGVDAGGERFDFDGHLDGAASGGLEFEPWRNDLTFHFRALSFLDERRVLYRSRLRGYDEEWLQPTPLPEIRYTNLAPGSYRLEVQAANAAGIWSDVAASPEIVLVPPLWRRPWFYVALGAALFATGFAGARVWAQRRYARRLEKEVERRTTQLRLETAERQRLESEAMRHRQLEALGTLAGGIAHDFNNLLTAVLGNLNLLELERPGRDQDSVLVGARDAALRARELTQRLLTFARGGVPVRRPVLLYEVIAEVAEENRRRFPEVSLKIDVDRRRSWVDADPGQIREVLDGLLRNAGEAMPQGGVVEIRGFLRPGDAEVTDAETGAANFVVEVEDQGVGIPAQDLERVFEPYFTTKPAASGLSLAAAHSIAEQHGGSLTACSKEGRGSVFRLELPATAPEEPEYDTVEVDPEALEDSGSAPEHRRVLVMDDEDLVRLVVVRMLGKLGWTPMGAASGEEAVELFAAAQHEGAPFSVVILDLTVPNGMGGRETLEKLRELDPEVRAIVCSGYSNDPVMARYEEHGFDAVLPKPFRLPALVAALEKVME